MLLLLYRDMMQTGSSLSPQIPSESNVHAVFERLTLKFFSFSHVFAVPLLSLLRMFFFFIARYFGFSIFAYIRVLRDPTFPAKINQNKKLYS